MTAITTYVSTGCLEDEQRHYFEVTCTGDGFIAQNVENKKIFVIGDSVESIFDSMEYFATVTLPFFELCNSMRES